MTIQVTQVQNANATIAAAQCVTRKRQVATLTLASGRTAVAPCD